MNKKNIMLVISDIGGAGAELVVYNLCRTLDKDRFNVSVCHLKERGEKGEILVAEGYDVVGIPKDSAGKTDYLSALKLKKLVKERNIDLLHSHNIEPLFEAAVCKLLTPGIKLIHTYHYGNYPHLPFRYLLLEFFFSRVANRLVAVGNRQREQIRSTYRLGSGSLTTVYNGIEKKPPLPSDKLPDRPRDTVVIGSMCTLIYQKGVDYLLEIARRMKDSKCKVVFWIVGEGPLRHQLEEQARRLELSDTVRFVGWVPNAAQTVMPEIDIFLQTSRWEAMSMVVLEAMAAGKPIVATNVGENERILTDADAGFIVEPGNIEETAARLTALAEDPELRRRLGENGEGVVDRKYSLAAMTRAYEALYDELLACPERVTASVGSR
ncbi:glycosyltransferase [bacterium]|nr:glycosyltransferase [bacterium]